MSDLPLGCECFLLRSENTKISENLRKKCEIWCASRSCERPHRPFWTASALRPPAPPFNVEKDSEGNADAAPLALELSSSTLNGGAGGRKAEAVQNGRCGRSQDRDAHQISHFLRKFSLIFVFSVRNKKHSQPTGRSLTSDSLWNHKNAHQWRVLKKRSHIGFMDPSLN